MHTSLSLKLTQSNLEHNDNKNLFSFLMLLHQDFRLEKIHGLMSMSSSIQVPLFCNIVAINHVESSTGWPTHFTKYSKYSSPLVFFFTLLSKIFSSCSLTSTGICFYHWTCYLFLLISSSSTVHSDIPALYLYKSSTLKIGDIPIPDGNSSSYALFENFLRILQGPIFLYFNLLYSLLSHIL